MKKQDIHYRLREYSLAASVLLLAKSEADSQIVYHHYSTPLSISSDNFMDLNNDGVTDFHFYVDAGNSNNGGYDASYEIYSWWASAALIATNQCAIAGTLYDLQKLSAGQLINSSLSWCQCGDLLALESVDYNPFADFQSGYWFGEVKGLLGFRLKDGANKYYGWMRISVLPYKVTVFDYAYGSVANQPIHAGDTGCDWLNATVTALPVDTTCDGDTIMLKVSPTNGLSFLWKKVGGLSLINATDSVYPVASGTGDYFVIVSIVNNCSDTSDAIHVVHLDSPPATIYLSNDTLFSNIPSVVQWYLNGNPIPGATEYYYVPLLTGNYEVVTTTGECFATSPGYYFSVTGAPITDDAAVPVIRVEDLNLIITFPSLESQSRIFSITDMLGRKRVQLTSADASVIIPIDELAAGEYILVIQGEMSQSTFKFLRM